jgi:competence protein ComEC
VARDPVLVLGLCALFGAAWLSAALPASLVLLLLLGLFWEQFPRALIVAGCLLLAVSGFRAHRQVEGYREHQRAAAQTLPKPERCALSGVVVSAPTVRGERMSFLAELETGQCENFALPPGERVRLGFSAPEGAGVTRGARFEAVAQLSVLGLLRNRELPDPTVRAARQGLAFRGSALSFELTARSGQLTAWIDRARAHARERIDATFAPDARGMAKALVLGENDLDEAESDAFKSSGLAHLLAVSGTHLVFAVLSLVSGLRFVLVRVASIAERVDVGRVAAFIGALLALLYADFAGGSGSAWRAAWMLAAALGARALGREANAARSVGASLLIGWVHDGLALYDVSFMLSLAATFGLLTLGRRGTRWLSAYTLARPLRLVAEGLLATLSSMLPCSVLLASLGPNVSLMGIVANVLAAPFGETVALPLCLAHPLVAWLPVLEMGLARVASGALLVVREVALFVGTSEWFRLDVPYPTDWQIAVLLFATLSAFQVATPRDRPAGPSPRLLLVVFGGLTCALLEVVAVRAGAPRGHLRFTVMDVGQGDAALVDFPDGTLMLIDGGGAVGSGVDPGERVIAPLLRVRRRDRVDVVVLSHPHPDHFGGLGAVFDSVTVGQLWDTGQGREEGAGPEYAALLDFARSKSVPVLGPDQLCGRREYAGTVLRILAPCPAFTPQINANDNSFVLHIGFGQRAMLLTGDAEAAEEAALVSQFGLALAADLLKVGHHGSRTSTGRAFVDAVRPHVATISAGQGNRFGHPHVEPLVELERIGAITIRTDLQGSVTWSTDGTRVNVRTFQN